MLVWELIKNEIIMQKELNLYELLYIVNSSFTEQELSKKVDFYKEFIVHSGSQVMVEKRGKRQLSYPIKGFETGNYIQMLYLGNGTLVKKLNSMLSRDDSVLRSITTKLSTPIEN